MKTYEVAGCIRAYLQGRDIPPDSAEHLIYSAGRAVGWIRMAADQLERSATESDIKILEYHAYVGISAARTALDAASGWLNKTLRLGLRYTDVNLSKKKFKQSVRKTAYRHLHAAQSLGRLGKDVDRPRHRL